jgi:hypothetical protein
MFSDPESFVPMSFNMARQHGGLIKRVGESLLFTDHH